MTSRSARGDTSSKQGLQIQNFGVWFLLLDNEPISGSHFSSFLHILPVKQYWLNFNEKYENTNYSTINFSYFYQIFNFIGSSVIYLSLSEFYISTHLRQFVLGFVAKEILLNESFICTCSSCLVC
jgi:hypothetical protein